MSRDVIMPALGMAQTTGLIVAWRKQPGDAVKAGDVLMEVETDKAVMEVAADADGYLVDVRAAAGEDVPVGDVIARIADKPTEAATARPAAAPAPAAPAPVVVAVAEPPPAKAVTAAPTPPAPRGNGRIFASPRARRLAAEQGLDLTKLVLKGEPQPYLVKHLTTLRALAPEPAPRGATQAAAAMRLTASVTGDAFLEFCAWRRAETGKAADEIAVIAGMAAASYRPNANGAPLVVAAEAFGRKRGFVDPDRAGLGGAQPIDAADEPSLVVRDLRGARVTDLHLGGEAAPVLTIMQRGPEMFVTLECAAAHMQPEAAIALISEFAGRLAEPLRHLL